MNISENTDFLLSPIFAIGQKPTLELSKVDEQFEII
jgi:hypothetical protein